MSDESPVKLPNAQRELLLAAENDTIVWLTRTEHEALMAAANDIYGLEKHFNKPAIRNEPLLRIVGVRNTIEQRAAALRAAGIDT